MNGFIPKTALAEKLGISIRTLENWCSHRGFPKPRRLPGSRLVFFDVVEVAEWLENALRAGSQR